MAPTQDALYADIDLELSWSERDLPERERTKHVHRLHPYLGKFIPQLVETLLERYLSRGGHVLDPFAGSGTTLVQALESGFDATGVDIAAFNCLLMRVKTDRYNLFVLERELRDVVSRLDSLETQIALELGAEARDLDALQYHPNGGAWPANMQGYSIPETTRAYGAVLLNADGEEFTDSLGPRDAVSQAIFDEVDNGKGIETPDGRPAVWLDTMRIPEADAEVSLPYMLRRYRAGGIDPLREKVLTYPVLHYQNGGLVIDENAETTLDGVYACGEIAGGTHGRNRMMGNSLLECVVFGRRAGRAAFEKARG